jgi:hypothetical protein
MENTDKWTLENDANTNFMERVVKNDLHVSIF